MIEHRMRLAGDNWTLHADRAMYWPRHEALLLTDVHFGKGSVLRRAGLAVPTGQTANDLARLDALIAHYQPTRVFVLGDLVHGAAPLDAPWIAQVNAWRERHASIDMTLIAGNHDRHFDARKLGFNVVAESLRIDKIVLRHEPAMIESSYVLAGHVHPGVMLHDGWRRHRLPAFRFSEHVGLLPAFGTLTGLHETPQAPDERIVAVTPAGLLPIRRDQGKPELSR